MNTQEKQEWKTEDETSISQQSFYPILPAKSKQRPYFMLNYLPQHAARDRKRNKLTFITNCLMNISKNALRESISFWLGRGPSLKIHTISISKTSRLPKIQCFHFQELFYIFERNIELSIVLQTFKASTLKQKQADLCIWGQASLQTGF